MDKVNSKNHTNTRLKGKELLELVNRNQGMSWRKLAIMAGYGNLISFQSALYKAKDSELSISSRSGARRVRGQRVQIQKNGSLVISGSYTRSIGIAPGTVFEIHGTQQGIKLSQISVLPHIHELLQRNVEELNNEELFYIVNFSVPPAVDKRFHELLDLKQVATLNDEQKHELKVQLNFYNLSMVKRPKAMIELQKRNNNLDLSSKI